MLVQDVEKLGRAGHLFELWMNKQTQHANMHNLGYIVYMSNLVYSYMYIYNSGHIGTHIHAHAHTDTHTRGRTQAH